MENSVETVQNLLRRAFFQLPVRYFLCKPVNLFAAHTFFGEGARRLSGEACIDGENTVKY